MNKQQLPIRMLLTGGGTGGHLFPGIAVAQTLIRLRPGSEVLFVGTRRKMDRASLERYGFAVAAIHCQGLKGKDPLSLALALAVLPLSFVEAAVHIRRFRPDIVLGVGGYVTGPVVAAAKLLGVPTVIHEQNSVPGLANRKLGRLVDRICVSLPGSERFFPPAKVAITGNPVRRDLLDLAADTAPAQDDRVPTVMVLGGSQGAHRVNELAQAALIRNKKTGTTDFNIIHQTGANDEEIVGSRYKEAGVMACVAAFFTDMVAVYRQVDLLICRAGATTLAELAVLGKPAILVPYPYAADNHQEKNARHYVEGKGAILFIERDLTDVELADTVEQLLTSGKRLRDMAAAMRRLAFPKAAEAITDICLELVARR